MAVNDILSTTLRKLTDQERDLLFRKLCLLDAATQADGIMVDASGNSWNGAVVTDDHASITNFSGSGFQAYNTAVNETLQTVSYDYAMNGIPALISAKERLLNAGPEARIELAAQRIRQSRAKFQRSAEQQWLAGSVPALAGWSSLYGGFSSSTDSPDGFLYGGATATDGGTVGGLARSVAVGLQNVREEQTGDLTDAITLAANKALSYSEMGGPGALIMRPETLAELENEQQDILRYASPDRIDAGVVVATFRGIPVYASQFMPDPAASGSGGTGVKVYGVNFDGIKFTFAPGEDFRFQQYERIPGTETEIASIRVFGQMVATHLASSFVVVDNA